MSNDTERHWWEQENQRLRSMLGACGVAVLETPAIFPTTSEFDRLLAIVMAAYPSLQPETRYMPDAEADEVRRQHRIGFERAFWALCFMSRRADPDRNRYPIYWREAAEAIRLQQCLPHVMSTAAFVCA